MYKALYRKWRPLAFSDVVGQQHVTKTLKNQVAAERLSHAYLFTGTRGTGKTTCAKILSRAVNCENPVDGDPCNACPSCLGILDGSVMDVLEMDAASNNGVDNIRDLRDEIVYTPASVKKRVYIIDEVHMLTGAAFNALLKTLEEPPEHALFILATTELHKVPATILSRCQAFTFKRIGEGDIKKRLLYIAEKEGFHLEPEAAGLIAHVADGALRDAESILDQCLSRGEVTLEAALTTLGMAGSDKIGELARAVGIRDTVRALELFGGFYDGGRDASALFDELCVYFGEAVRAKNLPDDSTGEYKELLGLFSTARFIYCIQTLQDAIYTFKNRRGRRTDAEICILKLCDESLSRDYASLEARLARLEELFSSGTVVQPATVPEIKVEAGKPADEPPWEAPTKPEKKEKPVPKKEVSAPKPKSTAAFWPELSAALKPEISQAEYTHLALCEAFLDEGVLFVSPEDEFSLMLLRGRGLEEKIGALTERFAGSSLNVIIGKHEPVKAEKPQGRLDELIEFGTKFGNLTIE